MAYPRMFAYSHYWDILAWTGGDPYFIDVRRVSVCRWYSACSPSRLRGRHPASTANPAMLGV